MYVCVGREKGMSEAGQYSRNCFHVVNGGCAGHNLHRLCLVIKVNYGLAINILLKLICLKFYCLEWLMYKLGAFVCG